MRTISILLYNRPYLIKPQLSALLESAADLQKFDKLIFSIDGGSRQAKECAEIVKACSDLFAREGIIDCDVIEHESNLGVSAHPLLVMRTAFEELGSDLHVNLEDDALPKKDLLRMILWWEEHRAEFPDCLLFAGCNHRDYGRGQQSSIPEEDPRIIAEAMYLSSPFCWALTKDSWPTVNRWWDFKTQPPTGFDWSLSMAMRLEKKVSMHPVLSRCQNVGKLDGVHETPDTFEKTQLGLKYQESEYGGDYALEVRVGRDQLNIFDEWMRPELLSMKNDEVKQWDWEGTTAAPTSGVNTPENRPTFTSRLRIAFEAATSISAVAPCLTFGNSHPINDAYSEEPKTSDFPNPWHIGTFDSAKYPTPHELIQAELEMLAFMFSLVIQLKPKLVVETGTNVGLMTRALACGCWANGFGKVVSSDISPEFVKYAKQVCKDWPADIRCCQSLELPELRQADLVFIDSSYESRTQEHKLIKSGAVYVYHDSYAEPWVRPEIEYEQFKVHLDSPRGFSIARKP